ncbi:MAG: hypothetical protein ACREDR_02670 [Blastocatellia bacterium]
MVDHSAESLTVKEQEASQREPRRPGGWLRKHPIRVVSAGLCVAFIAWAGFDLAGSHKTNLRDFDPDKVAGIETEMWRSYYSKRSLSLFIELTGLMRNQYHMPFLTADLASYHAAKSAFVFKEGHDRAEYEKALPDLVDYYSSIRRMSREPFEVDRVSRLELEWWIVHRNRASEPPEALQVALARLPAELYHVPADKLMEHARLRAEAMTIRDDKAEQGGVTEEDWARIDGLLHQSWRSLWRAVND